MNNSPSTTLDTKVAILEERINVYEQMMGKIDSAIEKISETNQTISKMLAVHEERLGQSGKSDAIIISMIEDVKKNITTEYSELNTKVNQLEIKVGDLFKFRWQVAAVTVTIVFVSTIFSQLAGGILTNHNSDTTIQEQITTKK
jgi:hypothetical protein